jgi:hypothetical protein
VNNTVERVHEEIEKEVLRRHSNRVLHGHPSPMLWLERDVPVAEVLEERARINARVPKRLLPNASCCTSARRFVSRRRRIAAGSASSRARSTVARTS